MTLPVYMVKKINWWNKPIRLARKTADGFEFIGWVWNQTAYVVNNNHHGQIAFIEDQTPEKLDLWKCHHCGAVTPLSQQYKIETYLKSKEEV